MKKFGIGAIVVLLAVVALFRVQLRHLFKTAHADRHSDGLFQNPEGLAIDSEGNLYVGDQDWGRFTMLDKAGKVVAKFEKLEGYVDGDGQPVNPTRGCNIAVIEPRHIVMVARHNVVEFKIEGDQAKLIRIIGSRGSGSGQMDGPEGLCVDSGRVWVTDEHNRRINVFQEGKFVASWPVPQDPQTVRVVKDRVYVALDKRNYLACYSKEGVEQFRIGHAALAPYLWIGAACVAPIVIVLLRKKWKWAGVGFIAVVALAAVGHLADFGWHQVEGEFRLPDSICLAPDGASLYITDRANGRIQVFDLDGHFKFAFGSYGKGEGQLRDPKDIVFDLDGNVIVADSDNSRLQVFTKDGKPLRMIR